MPKGRGLLVVSSYSGNTLEEHSFTIHLQSAGVSTLNFHPQHFPLQAVSYTDWFGNWMGVWSKQRHATTVAAITCRGQEQLQMDVY